MSKKSWDEMEEEKRESACEYTDYPICPYCGYEHDMDTSFRSSLPFQDDDGTEPF